MTPIGAKKTMKPICMNCGEVHNLHLASGHCAKQPGSLNHDWKKFDPAFIPKAPAGWKRATWDCDVRYSSRVEKISVTIPIKNFLRSRNPKEVLWLAIRAKRG